MREVCLLESKEVLGLVINTYLLFTLAINFYTRSLKKAGRASKAKLSNKKNSERAFIATKSTLRIEIEIKSYWREYFILQLITSSN